jgi:prevent-host-death family protein
MRASTWSVSGAKAKLSEVIEAQLRGPQTITRNGRRAVVVVAADEWERKTNRVVISRIFPWIPEHHD